MPESATPRCVHRNARRAALQLVRRILSGKLTGMSTGVVARVPTVRDAESLRLRSPAITRAVLLPSRGPSWLGGDAFL